MSLLFGAVVRSIGNITRDFPFNWIVFASVSHNLRASHSAIVLKIRTRNFSLAATGIITETRALLSPSRSQLAALFFNLDNFYTKRKISGHLDEKVAGNCNYYKTLAEVSSNLRQRPFFIFWSLPDFGHNFAKVQTRVW